MEDFCRLYSDLDSTTSTSRKVSVLRAHLAKASPADAAWTVYILTGGRVRRAVRTAELRQWATELAGLEEWLFEESYATVGDLAETIALVLDLGLPGPATVEGSLTHWIEDILLPLRTEDDPVARRQRVVAAWSAQHTLGRFCFTKLLTGGLRVGVSRRLVVRALAALTGLEDDILTHRLSGGWEPTEDNWALLTATDVSSSVGARPYPFFLASALDDGPDSLTGEPSDWLVEWKWDGIRGQLVRRDDEVWIWSRGGELVTDQFPEVVEAGLKLPPGTVVDGELLAWADDGPAPFSSLQRRLQRKRVGAKLLREVPVVLLAYDLLEWAGRDIRSLPLHERRAMLDGVMRRTEGNGMRLSQALNVGSWAEAARLRAGARTARAEGLMLKARNSPYRTGRRRGDWWKWKVDPLTLDAVLIYAQAGHGRRANLHTDYTFAVRNAEGELVPIAKAYSGLTDAEIIRLDKWIRENTRERFGPVRSVAAEQVFELAFEGIRRSRRHRSGLALRFPRILRWRTDKPVSEIDTVANLENLVERLGS
ncbi:MAG: ATP-dependent DNA ligase [Deltaproteobacteria bacterium]|nr:MAG: ATP-dependent DNA ligase [Deltaproteobacteria bacterium]